MTLREFFDPTLRAASLEGRRARWFHIVFDHDPGPARAFDLWLIAAILISVTVVILDSEQGLQAEYGRVFDVLEWSFTLLFTAEYLFRLWLVRERWRYARSFFGVIDLASILPTYLSLLIAGSETLLVVRILRILRVFRILKLVQYSEAGGLLLTALYRARQKIVVFLFGVMTIVVVFGAAMYVIEGPANGFNSIPVSMYWAIVTMATVGFGDIAPVTPLGRFVTSILILIGYSIIAVPTGIYTAELANTLRSERKRRECPGCRLQEHESDAWHCRRCGTALPSGD